VNAKSKTRELIEAVIIALFAALVLRQFVIASYKVPTGSMENTVLIGDFMFVNKFVYGAKTPDWIGIPFTRVGFEVPWIRFPRITKPEPYDIVVFKYPLDPFLDYIKRCIAVGGQTLEIVDKKVYVDGKPFPRPPHVIFIDHRIFERQNQTFQVFDPSLGSRDNFGPLTIPPHHYFMMGDNRDNSADSRAWGFVPPENIVGTPLIIWLSWDSKMPAYRLFHKIRWSRLGSVVR
jgi:signal peptidase I